MATTTTNPTTTWTRGRALGAGYISRRPLAESFARIVANVAALAVGADHFFAVGAAHVWVWMPRPYTWVISLVEVAEDCSAMEVLRTVGLCPAATAESRALEAVSKVYGGPLDGAPLVVDDFWSAEAAVGFALEWVTAPVLATAQHDHDPFAV